MKQLKILIPFLVFLVLSGTAIFAESGSEFEEKYYPIIFLKDDPSTFILAGDIDIRTSLNFKRAVMDVGVPEALFLSSNGGLVYIGLDLALEVGRLKIATIIPEDFGCYSACSYVFLAGVKRIAYGELGVHQISGEDLDLIGGQITIGDVIDVLNKFGTPPEIYPLMFSAAPNEMYILSNDELASLGLQGTRSLNASNIKDHQPPIGESFLEINALEFVGVAMDLSSGSGSQNLASILDLYAADVEYYGNDWTIDQIRSDKESFFKRWPQRSYELVWDNSRAVCTSDQDCLVTGLVRWESQSPQRNKIASGEARFEYTLTFRGGSFSITKENSRVIKRND